MGGPGICLCVPPPQFSNFLSFIALGPARDAPHSCFQTPSLSEVSQGLGPDGEHAFPDLLLELCKRHAGQVLRIGPPQSMEYWLHLAAGGWVAGHMVP